MEAEISSTSDELKFPQDPTEEPPRSFQSFNPDSGSRPFDDDDILDLAGGAQDALARHRATNQPEPDTEQRGAGAPEELKKAEDRTEEEKPHVEPVQSKSTLVELLYWRDLQRTGVCFGASLFLLLSLSVCSIVSVIAYISLALLSVTISFRIYKGIIQAVQKSEDGHPFKMYLEQDIAISSDLVHKYSELALARFNTLVKELRRLFLVEDLVDSLKFAVLMWLLTYVGGLFNGLTLIIIAHIAVFTWPVVYEKHQVQIDHYYELVNNQVKDVMKKIQAKIPGAKPKTE
ncbi:reticulon-4a isoform X1 [Astyanax mexicanus]|uniref:reticulon-4a isoform X1 n=1 Tax=Astyanax mexicanus TaxID=7994 RepID=UPI0020CB1614|nr:reticulon-4a isoform X1 [Astyanax mexicanus]